MRKDSKESDKEESPASDTIQRVNHLLNVLEQLYRDIDQQQREHHQQFEKLKSDAATALKEVRLHLNLLLQTGSKEASPIYRIPITDEKLKRAWEVLFRYPDGATADTVASGLDRHRSTVSTYLNMLVTLGFAEKFRDGHEIYYKAIIKSGKEENR